MASIVKRNNRFCVVYHYLEANGQKKQKWETFNNMTEAKKRLKEVEYKEQLGTFVVPKCKTVNDLMDEYIALYGRNKWAISTYAANTGVINNYIRPIIGDRKLTELTPRFLERYYQQLLRTRPVTNPMTGKPHGEFVQTGTIKEVHKLLRSSLNEAVKWELIDKNPALKVNVPRHEYATRDIWDAETLFKAIDLCEDETLKLCMNLAFACSLRLGEVLGLSWNCVDISEEAVEGGYASVLINKELQRVHKDILAALDKKDVIYVFDSQKKDSKSVLILKKPKTKSSIRKVYLPPSVARMLGEHKKNQESLKEAFGPDYKDHDLVICGPFGMPCEHGTIQDKLNKLIEKHNLPKVVFHSLRHSSITYKLKLNGGDVKAVQGDSGHAQSSMVTDVYSHILDEGRVRNARLLEDAFYSKKETKEEKADEKQVTSERPEELTKLIQMLSNPETAALLRALLGPGENR